MPKGAAIIDVGGGSSTLVDDLLSSGYSDITVFDVSEKALDYSKTRLGAGTAGVTWMVGDVTTVEFPRSSFDLWHDRALFHFLVREEERRRYCSLMEASIRPGGYAVIATFGPHGPPTCSGLEVVRYSGDALQQTLGNAFHRLSCKVEQHITPGNVTQEFTYCLFRKEV